MRDRAAPRPTFVLARGAYDAPTERVEPGTPAALGALPKDLPPNRLGLARWLRAPAHPLTARVIVNRYWALLFGRGLVATPADFGSQGRLPTHPALLDWLATTFVASGWDLKALQKRIVLSATYRQSSVADAATRERDPVERVAGARAVVPAGGRADPRRRARRERPAGRDDRRTERLSVSAARAVGGARDAQRDDLRRGQGRRPVSPQPLHGLEAVVAAAVGDQLRCGRAPVLHGQPRSARARRCRRSCCSTIRSTSKPRARSPSG